MRSLFPQFLLCMMAHQAVVAKDSAFVVDRLLSAKLPPPVRAECGAGRYDLPPCPVRCLPITVEPTSIALQDSASGRNREELVDSLRRRVPSFRFLCERRYPRIHSDLNGKVVLALRISPSGVVDSAQVLDFPEADRIRQLDFLRTARTLRFSPGRASTRLTWSFELRTEKK